MKTPGLPRQRATTELDSPQGTHMRLLLNLAVMMCLVVTGCGVYVVKKSTPAGDHHGIPFYVKQSACKREVILLEPYYVLTLTTKQGDKVVSAESTVLSRSQFNSQPVVELRNLLASSSPAGSQLRLLWDQVRGMHYEPHVSEFQVKPDDWYVVSDTVTPDVYVDYEHPYTLNARRPAIGSSEATTKLNEDGTLSEATAKIDDKTISSLLDLIPAKELIKGAAGIAAFDGGGTVAIELAVEPKGINYSRSYRILKPCTAVTRADFRGIEAYDLKIEEADSSKSSKDSGDSISVSGTIKLPKAKTDKK
jgi:hypothetical protein